MTSPVRSSRSWRPWLLGMTLLLALALRLVAARGELWFDELVSLRTSRQGVAGVLAARNDNNHLLNTLYLGLLGDAPDALQARALSIALGVATVAACYWSVGGAVGLLTALLAAINFPLILYSSEARGYSGAVLAGLVAFGSLRRWLIGAHGPWVALYYVSFLLGVLFHVTFAFVWAALAAWTIVALLRRMPPLAALRRVALLHGPALVLLAAYYFLFVRGMEFLGGPEWGSWRVVREFFAYALGWPLDDRFSMIPLLLGLAALALWLAVRHRRDGPNVPLFLSMVLAAGPLAILAFRPPYLYPRYLVTAAPFVCMLLAYAIVPLRRVGLAVVLLIACGQAWWLVSFLQTGRNHLGSALAYIAQHTTGPAIAIAGDSPFRLSMELPYFARRLPPGKHLQEGPEPGGRDQPEWFLLHDLETPPQSRMMREDGSAWDLVRSYPGSGISGESWILYHTGDQR